MKADNVPFRVPISELHCQKFQNSLFNFFQAGMVLVQDLFCESDVFHILGRL